MKATLFGIVIAAAKASLFGIMIALAPTLSCLAQESPAAGVAGSPRERSLANTQDGQIPVARVQQPPELDGALDDAAWRLATVVDDFLQRLPVEGARPTERTEVYLAHTSSTLYVGVRAYHRNPEDVVATVMRRDDFEQIVKNEQFVIAIDSYNDGRNGYWFSTNPLGVRVDAQFFNDGDLWESNWDGHWHARARTDEQGWTAELEIPFSTLRFPEAKTNLMGINLFRRIIHSNEQLFAPLIPLRYAWGTPNVSAARKYAFEGISAGRSLRIKPFAVSGLRQEPPADPGTSLDAGVDLRHNLTDNLTVNLSVNTDFAQAEVDERQINLTRYSLFFPEKRDFFLENAGTFSFGVPRQTELFFSRNIGLARDDRGQLTAVPILAGVKVTGAINGVDVGVLDVQTRSAGAQSPENIAAARFKIGVAPRSYVGGIVTNKLARGSYNRVYGGDFTYYLVGDVGITGFAATETTSSRDFRFRAASALHLALFKGGERTSFMASVLDVGAAFDPALGFVQRKGVRQWTLQARRPWYVPSRRLRRIIPGFATTYYAGHDGLLQSSSHRLLLTFEAPSADQVTFSAVRSFEVLPFDFAIFRDVVVPANRYVQYDLETDLETKPGRTVWGRLAAGGGRFFDGSRLFGQASAEWKASRYVTLSQFYGTSLVTLPGASFRTHLVRSRVNFALNTSLSAAGLVQYDNATDVLGLNLRISYLFREGTELFIVYNDAVEHPLFGDRLASGRLLSRTILLKFTYLFDA